MARITGHKIVDKWQLVVNMDGLQYQGNNGMRFNLYIAGYYDDPISTADSDNNGGEANVIFNITRVSPGWTQFVVKRVMFGTGNEYPVGYPFDEFVPEKNTPTPPPDPTPRTQPMTAYIIDEISFATDRSVTVSFRVNGYGSISMYSETWWQEGFKKRLAGITIYENDYDIQDGRMKTVELSYRFDDYGEESKFNMYGERGLPLGTVELKFSQNPYRDDWIGNADIFCIDEYHYEYYDKQYEAEIAPIISGYSMTITNSLQAPLFSVRRDWQLLINVFYYLSSTTIGQLKFGRRADYIPRKGDVLTADMYNGLIDIANSCLAEIKYKYGWSARDLNPTIPDKVSKGDIISKYFIFHLGKAANAMSKFIQKQVNDNLIGRWSELR